MESLSHLNAAVTVFGAALSAAWLFRLLRLPSIIGFLVAGIAIGPSGLRLVPQPAVGQFAEFGLILLLFTIGIELSPEPLMRMGSRLVVITLIQVSLTTAVAFIALTGFTSLGPSASLILGIAVALSSTAIVLKQLGDRGEAHSSTGMITTGILLLQDVIVIVVMLFLSLIAGKGDLKWTSALVRGLVGVTALAAVFLASRRLLPVILNHVIRYGGRELITLFGVLMACGGAFLAGLAGWSPGLGACIAGLLLAETDQRRQLVAEITPFRDVFNALFFVSLGMLVNLGTVFAHPFSLLACIVATILLKPLITCFAAMLGRWPVRVGLQVGIVLGAVSEFSYVLAHEAHALQILPSSLLDGTIAYTVGTMIVGALLFPVAGPLAAGIARRIHARRSDVPGLQEIEPQNGENHVIIVGYGFTGASLAKMLGSVGLPHCVIDMNLSLVKAARDAGSPAHLGDATRMGILEHAWVKKARALVVAINDSHANQAIVGQVCSLRPDMYVLSRTAFVTDIDRLYQLGAKQVIPQDFETSIEVAAHVLKQFGIPDNVVEAQIAAVRAGRYGMLRGKPTDRAAHEELIKVLERTATQTFFLDDQSPACGRTVAEVNLRALSGCLIIAVVRQGTPFTNPPPDFAFQRNDVLVLVGTHRQLDAAKAVLQG